MSAPAIVIRLEVEEPIIVYADCLTDGEEARLSDWLDAHSAHAQLVEQAFELARRERAA